MVLCHPADCERVEDAVDEIIIRNVWNQNSYPPMCPDYLERFIRKKLVVHDDIYRTTGADKTYLVGLYKQGYPVIPTVDSVKDVSRLPATDEYFIKPKDGFDAIEARRISLNDLIRLNPLGYCIQPLIDFDYEISFYYLDKHLQYVLYAPDKNKRWNLYEFTPSVADIDFAERFIRWSKQRYGIERVDACRLRSGELLLMEIEDQGGMYLSVQSVMEANRKRFLNNLKNSISQRIGLD